MAFPYVAMREQGTMENSLLTEFYEACDHGLGLSNVILAGSCSVQDQGYEKLVRMGSMHDYLVGTIEMEIKGQHDLIVYCHGDLDTSERDVFYSLINSLDQSGVKYSVLYASDPHKSSDYPSNWQIERFLSD
ncbi:hypothetical protein Dimus_033671, partial [Dionaea muscipula]